MGVWNISIYNVYSRMNPILVYKGDVKEEAGSDDYGNPNVTYRNAFKSIGIFRSYRRFHIHINFEGGKDEI